MKQIIISTLFLIACAACVPDLDLERVDTKSVNTFYQTPEDANSAAVALYGQLRDLYRDEVINTPNNIASDDAIPFLTGNADRVALWNYNLTPVNTFVGEIWASAYSGIQRSNILLARVPAIDMDEDLKGQYLGEAYFLRALHYFNLVRFFGEVPLVLEEVSSLADIEVPRQPIDDVYNAIVDDLQQAEQLLPLSYTGNDEGRATRGAAMGLLAKVWLTRAGDDPASSYWGQAADKAEEVINLGLYDLWENYQEVFDLANRCGKESLFEVLYITDLAGNNLATGYAPRGAPIVPGNGSGILRVTGSLFNLYEGADERKSVTFLTSYIDPSTGGQVELSAENPDPALAVSFWKLADLTATLSGQAGKSFPYLRFSDILLIYAEALNERNGGPTEQAYTALNRVRERAGLPELRNLDQTAFREAVLNERRLELCFEANRWFDIVRRNRLVETVRGENSFSRNANIQTFNRYLPIPQREMDANGALTQNEGY
ncbi:RagB/SusD family nutrient uptake outer membrane protein [Olivibacter sp. SDN3]|uniref:RagB/SusD family nutrient uptake outer membrane protein n=1 Tax=Olivibacter sp. SDN3 TaxID=2764720 RepID=UPI0016511714|nr:RagB/SusD family nutrient uptake outer membrane protein [Olivibacter sp. SDN3]QNL51672.1 RagB/SusD family nutrient uptake outer membrane protein [Olivibacter sp. SDN3]